MADVLDAAMALPAIEKLRARDITVPSIIIGPFNRFFLTCCRICCLLLVYVVICLSAYKSFRMLEPGFRYSSRST